MHLLPGEADNRRLRSRTQASALPATGLGTARVTPPTRPETAPRAGRAQPSAPSITRSTISGASTVRRRTRQMYDRLIRSAADSSARVPYSPLSSTPCQRCARARALTSVPSGWGSLAVQARCRQVPRCAYDHPSLEAHGDTDETSVLPSSLVSAIWLMPPSSRPAAAAPRSGCPALRP